MKVMLLSCWSAMAILAALCIREGEVMLFGFCIACAAVSVVSLLLLWRLDCKRNERKLYNFATRMKAWEDDA